MDDTFDIEGIFRRHFKTVWRLCYSYLGSSADAEDATQAVFMKLLDKPRSFESEGHEKAWLIVCASNWCKDLLKSAGRTRVSTMDAEGTPEFVADPTAGIGIDPAAAALNQNDEVLSAVRESFDFSSCGEFTVEAGRPDTITREKLRVMKSHGVNRISINPQSMKQKTLDIIGRSHTPEDIIRAFETAKAESFDVINADLIAGLPEETPDDFKDTLEKILELGAGNVTIHTLAVKRASRLIGIDSEYHDKAAGRVGEMLKWSRERLDQAGLLPYYLYRQKHMAGYFENTGYAVRGAEGIYHIRIMDEHQSILALGAGGISKRYFPELNRLVRVPNVTNYTEYIKRIEEMCMRKENKFFN